jgi:glycosyltransferase involved in cell wall biosynthesis
MGYVGNLAAYKIDIDLVYALARRRPDWTIALIGPLDQGEPGQGIRRENAPPNVWFGGPVPHSVVPAVIDRFDVCLLPSAKHDIMRASFPLKFFEYLMRSRPVVARPLPALEPFRDFYDEAVTAADFESAIERRLTTDSAAEGTRRRKYARGFNWTERIKELRELRDDLLVSRASRPATHPDDQNLSLDSLPGTVPMGGLRRMDAGVSTNADSDHQRAKGRRSPGE